ncbi:reverse transcriptase domain-containing protein [Sphingopyxis sp. EG6]|uniref:reverse transcriptase domain-containing protein n=1 Tax=Sphingopyxis sp. EG6 TaxID=1874061 RepID=UPI000E7185D1|nr:reverse transcriptase domain-containing protein [Sphingopyxis sp. EG6]
MEEVIRKEIERKARRILDKQRHTEHASIKHAKRFTKRTGKPSTAATLKDPSYWEYDTQFDPAYCIRHSKFLARVIWRKIQNGSYAPKPAILFKIPKPDGGVREIMQFAIPDSAIANIFHRKLTSRNKGLFSSYSFAYRPDKSIFEAIIHLQRMMQPSKTFILQYDYRKYFDTINHKYLEKLVYDGPFVVSSAERNAISAFLKHDYDEYASWQTMKYQKRSVGVPQGSSLSLFLSNIAAHELDMELEKLNGSFVRFADDVIAVAHSYSDARQIELKFREHCEKTGVSINFEKSHGIQLLSGRDSDDKRWFFVYGDDGGQLNKAEFVDFLGHRVSSESINLTAKAVKRIKKRISRIINIHLILYARKSPPSPINPDRLGSEAKDWDLVTCLNEIRRYIYGGLRESDLMNFIEKDKKLRFVRGLLAFYPLVTDPKTLIELDGWLKSVIKRAIRERNRLIAGQGLDPSKLYAVTENELLDGSWYKADVPNESILPSFVRGWRAARKFYKRYGLSEIQSPSYYTAISRYT